MQGSSNHDNMWHLKSELGYLFFPKHIRLIIYSIRLPKIQEELLIENLDSTSWLEIKQNEKRQRFKSKKLRKMGKHLWLIQIPTTATHIPTKESLKISPDFKPSFRKLVMKTCVHVTHYRYLLKFKYQIHTFPMS